LPTGPDGLDIRPLNDDDEPAVLALLGRSLGWHDDSRFRDLYRWKHVENAFGRSFGWVATASERIVGVRLFMRWEFARGGEILHAVRAVDTATDPDYQGRGLFTALTLHGLDEVRAAGIDFVFNTPNAQSMPGYLKMGWREVGGVPASIRPMGVQSLPRLLRSRLPAEHWSIPVDVGIPIDQWLAAGNLLAAQADDSVRSLRTASNADLLRWRYSMPHLHYRVVDCDGGAVVVRMRRRATARELVLATSWGLASGAEARLVVSVARQLGADHVVRVGHDRLPGFVMSPRLGPILTWRSVNQTAMPPLSNWSLEMGDIELM
jgi:GNAT superfamily N-acetyltransferase